MTITYATLLSEITTPDGRDIFDPATGELVGKAPFRSVEVLDAAVARAKAAQPSWAARTDEERQSLLVRAADAIDAATEPLAELLSREQGKPLNGPNARFEVGACANWLRATAATDLPGRTLIDDGETHAEIHYRPLGVVGAIGPWNWPMMISIWQIAPSLRMGNTVVVKPSEYTPLSVLALAHVLGTVLPDDVVNVVAGEGDLGARLSSHPDIAKLMFTGSTRTGQAIIKSSAETVKRLTLELGGNDAGIVLADVDPKAIAQDLFWGAFINTGQTCAALKRLYVHADVYEDVCRELVEVAKTTPMGRGLDEDNVLGPLQNKAQFDIVAGLVAEAKSSGATILTGGTPEADAPGYFYPTTLVSDIDNSNPLVTQEQFGPALPIVRFETVDEAVDMANGIDVGLGASVWSADLDTARTVAARIQAGTVWINSHGGVHPMIPFGGVKKSGYGLEFGIEGLAAVSAPQVING
ncbi:aldehyde dehydrogenase family protein [Rhodococcus sp. IEGM 1381]|uniref:aldehyde dehydrogenase family protein n=1 Tax=Rhodococcus sp. IEGM 1381 TaxID=3047085 RepID=UPI0024B685C9|nr:aldehyde dehydrogenase family protein [Rhodococcus sp. IEGM 1381]MDI9893302.1 aldehyde dehydrogenase family protein [Rhodococcus sp. IEGM 1381]